MTITTIVDGIDLNTREDSLQRGEWRSSRSHLLRPKQAFWFATLCLLIAMGIGIYFVLAKGWLLFPLLLIAGFLSLFL